MFLEGHGRVREASRAGGVAPLINALILNAKSAIDTLWKQRGKGCSPSLHPLGLLLLGLSRPGGAR